MTFGGRLRAARKRKGYTQKSLAQKINAKHNSVSNWENGQNMPDPGTIENLCVILDISPNYLLMGGEMPPVTEALPHAYSGSELALLRMYRRLDKNAQGAVDALLHYYMSQQSSVLTPPAVRLENKPVLELIAGKISSQSVAAGYGTYLDADAFDTISLQKNTLTRRASFYVPVSGDSMEPQFYDGDVLIVENVSVKPGDIGIFTLDNHGYVKLCGNGELISLNDQYAPIPMKDDIICNGKVIGVLDPEWIVG